MNYRVVFSKFTAKTEVKNWNAASIKEPEYNKFQDYVDKWNEKAPDSMKDML